MKLSAFTRLISLSLLILLLAPRGFAEMNKKPSWKKRWILSAVAVVAATALDARSSVGRFETNPLLRDSRGRFSLGRGIAFKAGTAGALFGLQSVMARRNPEAYRTGALVNFVSAAAFGAVAVRNGRSKADPCTCIAVQRPDY